MSSSVVDPPRPGCPRAESHLIRCIAVPALARVSHFRGAGGVDEFHLAVEPTEPADFGQQLEWLELACDEILASFGIPAQSAVLRRFFCSDLVNQSTVLSEHPFSQPCRAQNPCAVSWICQPPGAPAKVALWAYHISDPDVPLNKAQDGRTLIVRRGDCSHHWTTNLANPGQQRAQGQTHAILEEYDAYLTAHGMRLASDAIRTWFFVQNIDADYRELVEARKEYFTQRGLTPQTHYIASSGIGGGHAKAAARVAMDAYSISGLHEGQVAFLSAPDHLGPTHLYGVTFERGTSIAYRDRRHLLISGTASIDPRGEIIHPGNVGLQLDRTLENVEALLFGAGATLEDLVSCIAYVRDPADQGTVGRRLRDRLGELPFVVVVAPVCRPGWLVEVEGIAIIAEKNPHFPKF
jgi:enamine deaminase RidA (YjgF/YER057c/UK114 family)